MNTGEILLEEFGHAGHQPNVRHRPLLPMKA
jgi:hypothetical protein